MNEYSEECILTFLRNQEQLFYRACGRDRGRGGGLFLEDCMAAVGGFTGRSESVL